MIYVQTHFNLNRILMLAVGLWPYQRSRLVQFQLILLLSILTSCIVFQLTTLLTAECTPDLIIKVLTCSLFFSISVITYNSFWFNIHNVKYSFEQLQNICNELKDEGEITIIKKYGNNTKRYTVILSLLAMCSTFLISFLPIWPQILNTILSINVSQSRRIAHIMTEYFIDQERYFYLILLHINTAICIGVTAVIATGTMLLGYLVHTCGLFSIVSYRIKQAMTFDTMKNANQKNQILIYKKMVCAIDMHRKAMKFSEFLMSAFEGLFFLLIGIGVIMMSLSLYGIASCRDNISEFLLYLITIGSTFMYIFVSNYIAQNITDHNNDIFVTVYNFQWYMSSLPIQKMTLFLLQRGTKAFHMNIGGLFVASLQNAATLMSTSISYFTVLYSMRN
ncbi:hypothetical protein HN011_007583 [Eciton burchellii]|nr:hypothetical protein HN011_007583 [Eciton burchellii]